MPHMGKGGIPGRQVVFCIELDTKFDVFLPGIILSGNKHDMLIFGSVHVGA